MDASTVVGAATRGAAGALGWAAEDRLRWIGVGLRAEAEWLSRVVSTTAALGGIDWESEAATLWRAGLARQTLASRLAVDQLEQAASELDLAGTALRRRLEELGERAAEIEEPLVRAVEAAVRNGRGAP